MCQIIKNKFKYLDKDNLCKHKVNILSGDFYFFF